MYCATSDINSASPLIDSNSAGSLNAMMHQLAADHPEELQIIYGDVARRFIVLYGECRTPMANTATAAAHSRSIAWRQTSPTPGWKPRALGSGATALANPRPPAVPATLQLTLEQYYAGCGAIGMLAAQGDEPNMDWIVKRSIEFGEKMAKGTRRRRLRK